MVEQFGLLVRRAYACLQFRRIVHICRIEIPDLGNVQSPFSRWTPKKINSRKHQHGIIGANSAGDPWRF